MVKTREITSANEAQSKVDPEINFFRADFDLRAKVKMSFAFFVRVLGPLGPMWDGM